MTPPTLQSRIEDYCLYEHDSTISIKPLRDRTAKGWYGIWCLGAWYVAPNFYACLEKVADGIQQAFDVDVRSYQAPDLPYPEYRRRKGVNV